MAQSDMRRLRKLLMSMASELDRYERRVNSTEMLAISHTIDPGTLCESCFTL